MFPWPKFPLVLAILLSSKLLSLSPGIRTELHPILWCQTSVPNFPHLYFLHGTRATQSLLLGTVLHLLRVCPWLFTVLTLCCSWFFLKVVIRTCFHCWLSPPHCHAWSMTSAAIAISKGQSQPQKRYFFIGFFKFGTLFYQMHAYVKHIV